MRLDELLKTDKPDLSRSEISKIIRKGIRQAGHCDAWEVNNGWCSAFAYKLAKILGPKAKVVNSTTDYKDGTFPGHSWVEYNGYHFDAESPYGEKEPKDMQYHKRLRAVADSEGDEDMAVFKALGKEPVYPGKKFKESFDSGVETEEDPDNTTHNKDYTFTVNGVRYELSIYVEDMEQEDVYTVVYGFKNEKGLRKYKPNIGATTSDALAVLGTVVSVVIGFVKEYDPDVIEFSGRNNGDVNLGRTYEKMIKRFEPKIRALGYSIDISKYQNSIVFRLIRD